ncbi:MAG: HIRAN domain-containing protein [Planctomycetota bacterium]
MQAIDFHTKIAGVTFSNDDGSERQSLIEDLADQLDTSGSAPVTLKRDRANPHDVNAIAVLDGEGRQLGFLPARVSAQVAPLMDRGVVVKVEVACVTGNGLLQNYGVNIRVWTNG